jgi:hypothetical protein
MDKQIIGELLSYFQDAEDIKGLREGLYFVVWSYLEENIDTGLDRRIHGVFLTDFNSLIEVLSILEKEFSITNKRNQ